jgi:hypothetical protein
VTLELDRDGAQLFPGALDGSALEHLRSLFPSTTGPGERIYRNARLADWLTNGPAGIISRQVLGDAATPVRAILFDKTPGANWSLGWHQDRTIAVRERIDRAGFDHWNSKAGVTHVEPSFDVLKRMLTARIHLDPVPANNAPLLIAPGSHGKGRIAEDAIEAVVKQCGSFACLAAAGDIWLYRTTILHASDRSRTVDRRRVLQVDYSAEKLPGDLEWRGVG